MNFLCKILGIFILSLFLGCCQQKDEDTLNDLGQSVIKTKQGIQIDIVPKKMEK